MSTIFLENSITKKTLRISSQLLREEGQRSFLFEEFKEVFTLFINTWFDLCNLSCINHKVTEQACITLITNLLVSCILLWRPIISFFNTFIASSRFMIWCLIFPTIPSILGVQIFIFYSSSTPMCRGFGSGSGTKTTGLGRVVTRPRSRGEGSGRDVPRSNLYNHRGRQILFQIKWMLGGLVSGFNPLSIFYLTIYFFSILILYSSPPLSSHLYLSPFYILLYITFTSIFICPFSLCLLY